MPGLHSHPPRDLNLMPVIHGRDQLNIQYHTQGESLYFKCTCRYCPPPTPPSPSPNLLPIDPLPRHTLLSALCCEAGWVWGRSAGGAWATVGRGEEGQGGERGVAAERQAVRERGRGWGVEGAGGGGGGAPGARRGASRAGPMRRGEPARPARMRGRRRASAAALGCTLCGVRRYADQRAVNKAAAGARARGAQVGLAARPRGGRGGVEGRERGREGD
jgi:hypothetical protein